MKLKRITNLIFSVLLLGTAAIAKADLTDAVAIKLAKMYFYEEDSPYQKSRMKYYYFGVRPFSGLLDAQAIQGYEVSVQDDLSIPDSPDRSGDFSYTYIYMTTQGVILPKVIKFEDSLRRDGSVDHVKRTTGEWRMSFSGPF